MLPAALIPSLPLAMVEVLVVLFIVGTVLFVWLACYIQTRARRPDPTAELQRLEQYSAWLEDRWQHAVTQNYDEQMKARIAEERRRTDHQLKLTRACILLGDRAA